MVANASSGGMPPKNDAPSADPSRPDGDAPSDAAAMEGGVSVEDAATAEEMGPAADRSVMHLTAAEVSPAAASSGEGSAAEDLSRNPAQDALQGPAQDAPHERGAAGRSAAVMDTETLAEWRAACALAMTAVVRGETRAAAEAQPATAVAAVKTAPAARTAPDDPGARILELGPHARVLGSDPHDLRRLELYLTQSRPERSQRFPLDPRRAAAVADCAARHGCAPEDVLNAAVDWYLECLTQQSDADEGTEPRAAPDRIEGVAHESADPRL